jgi:hypothetical protein
MEKTGDFVQVNIKRLAQGIINIAEAWGGDRNESIAELVEAFAAGEIEVVQRNGEIYWKRPRQECQ